jgi:homoserine dehydrogenase
MQTYRLALIGFGNVGQGLVSILHEHGIEYAQRFGANFQVVAVTDIQKGAVFDPDGLYLAELLAIAAEGASLDKVQGKFHGWDALKTIQESNADVIVEMTYTNLQTGQPAITHVETALKAGKHVVTTNKGPAALKYSELLSLAKEHGVDFGVEGTVMSGTPTINLGLNLLSAAGIQKIQGILNGTTNYILTQMGAGAAYPDALAEAQKLGYAEADPTGDVEGFDAAGKVVILANLMMNAQIGMKDVDREGITRLTLADISSAKAANERWKLIGRVEKTQDSIQASVKPTRLPLAHPLASVDGATNAVTFTTKLMGDVTLIGPGAGRLQTGYSVIVDLLEIHRKHVK